jgi:hypothetical protein
LVRNVSSPMAMIEPSGRVNQQFRYSVTSQTRAKVQAQVSYILGLFDREETKIRLMPS